MASNETLMNWKGHGRKRSWHSSLYYSGIFPEKPRETIKSSETKRSIQIRINIGKYKTSCSNTKIAIKIAAFI
jgi:hypothetical protein